MFSDADTANMRSALHMARRGLGRTWPNPSVGCVIVKKGHVLARTRTADGGRPHAETQALEMAGEAARGASVYVTLEPCSHEGKTPPCVKALIDAGVARVVVAMEDPDARVNGAGIKALRDAGIDVSVGCLEDQARDVLSGYIMHRTQGRPFVTLKIASSLDSIVAMADGESQWITGPLARQYGHLERGQHDMIVTGIGTVERDNPSLTVRLNGVQNDPVRLLFDGKLQLSPACELVASAEKTPTWIVCGEDCDPAKVDELLSTGVQILKLPLNANGIVPLSTVLPVLAERGITKLMVEGGSLLITEFLKAGFCDRLLWFRAPCILGNEGISAVQNLNLPQLVDRMNFRHKKRRVLGPDVLDEFERL